MALLPRRGRILCRTLSVCLSVRLSICLSVHPSRYCLFYSRTVLRANIQNRKTSVFIYGPASRMYFSACTEGRISYGHLGRTNSCFRQSEQSIMKLRCQKNINLHGNCGVDLSSSIFDSLQHHKGKESCADHLQSRTCSHTPTE